MPTHHAFSFRSQALPDDTFTVIRFSGEEGLSQLYRFEVLLVSSQSDLDCAAVVQSPAVFTLERPAGKLPFHGILESFEQLQQEHGLTVYRAVLVPRLWWLTLTHHNQVFLDKSCPQLIEAVLQDGGLAKGQDFELRLQQSYPAWEYVCQYGESHFAFVSRWMERYGLYYFFEQQDAGEKLIITDSALAHTDMPQGGTLRYSPKTGLEAPYKDEVATAFRSRRSLLPATVLLKDYNYEKPSLELQARAQVAPDGEGEVYSYGEHFRTQEEGQLFATIRAQTYACRGLVCESESSVPFLRTGYTVTLEQHFLPALNRRYLVTHMTHEGSQAAYLSAGFTPPPGKEEEGLFYRNTAALIPAEVQFRPLRVTPQPRFHGVLNATVDAATSGQYAELDEHGRYKVILPFDLSGRKDGKASSRLRMLQPYVGADHGMHLPLHKGTEVLLSFIDGDPDRPFIAAAVPNPTHKSQVTAATASKSLFTSSGQNLLHIEDRQGSERILMHSPTANTFLRIGAPNDPASPNWEPSQEKAGVVMQTDDAFQVFAGTENEVIIGEASSTVGGFKEKIVAIFDTEINALEFFEMKDPWSNTWSPVMKYLHGNAQSLIGSDTLLSEELLEMCGQVFKMRAMKEKLEAQKTAIANSKQELVQLKTELAEDKTHLGVSVTHLTELKQGVVQNRDSLVQARTQLDVTKTEVAETKTAMAQSRATLQGERIRLNQAITSMGQSKTVMAGTISHIAEDFNVLADMTTKV